MSSADPADYAGLADWEDHAASTRSFLPLMQLLERFAQYCFRRDLSFFVDSGTLLGVVRHRAIVPWDYDVDLGMGRSEYQRLVNEFDDPPGLRLDHSAYDQPDATLCVVPPPPLGPDDPYLDIVRYEPDGRSTMSEPLQRRWPLDMWRAHHDERSWSLRLRPGRPRFAGRLRVVRPAARSHWLARRLVAHDSWHARPESLARCADLPFDPLAPAVMLARPTGAQAGLADTRGERPPSCGRARSLLLFPSGSGRHSSGALGLARRVFGSPPGDLDSIPRSIRPRRSPGSVPALDMGVTNPR